MYPIATLGRGFLGQQAATYGCPWTPPAGAGGEAAFPVTTDPTLNCMKDARGNTICSDGSHYPPGCPKTPPPEFFSPGITPDVTTNGMIEGQIPPPKTAAAAPAPAPAAPAAASPAPSPLLMAGAGALGASILAVGAYFLFKK